MISRIIKLAKPIQPISHRQCRGHRNYRRYGVRDDHNSKINITVHNPIVFEIC